MSEELISRLEQQAAIYAAEGYLQAAVLLREAADALSRPAPAPSAPVAVAQEVTLIPDFAMVENPLDVQERKQCISAVLRQLASQENCDGSPYDQMVQAADIIDVLLGRLAVAPPVGWRAILNDAYDAIGAGTDAVRCNMERGYVEPVLDGICSGLERLEINTAHTSPSVDAEKVMGLVNEYCHQYSRYGYGQAAQKVDSQIRALLASPAGMGCDYHAVAQFLYGLLDDIDTAGDMAKADDSLYRKIVERTQARKREVVAECDGYTVTFKTPAIANQEEVK